MSIYYLLKDIIMEYSITITQEDINNHPNDFELGSYIRRKFYEHKDKKYDKCVICGAESPYTMDTHIDLRHGYIEGAGQGCFRETCKN